MLARDLMTRNVAYCTVDTSLREAAQLMRDHDCGCLPVTRDEDGKDLVGLVTDRDLACRAVADGMETNVVTVDAIMSTPVETVDESTPIEECLDRLREKQIRRLVVTGGDGKCSGVLAQGDVARELPVQQTGDLVKQVSRPDQGRQPKAAIPQKALPQKKKAEKKATGPAGGNQRSR